ncbi:MAG TPA: four helix bundle protein [candidate division WOR-3 bacterium]|uniref:Four helix bundle protein n=1 Tax=candidate division WOR-3 bacterium TaxID=2052148 RepID=A0A9C9JZH4_UNCW3|nr:four helix bundle protein [candidate division WOR-3 bacterium]
MLAENKEKATPNIVEELLLCRSVYSMAFEVALRIFELSQGFPRGGPHSLHSKIIQYSSAVCEKLTEAWQNRCETDTFIGSLNDAAVNATEAQAQIDFAAKAGIITAEEAEKLNNTYEDIIDKITGMIKQGN